MSWQRSAAVEEAEELVRTVPCGQAGLTCGLRWVKDHQAAVWAAFRNWKGQGSRWCPEPTGRNVSQPTP